MEPVSPVLPFSQPVELRVAESQPEFKTLPSFRTNYTNISRWRLTDSERQHLLNGGDLFIAQINGQDALQPIVPMAIAEDKVLEEVWACEQELGLK